MVPMRNLLNDAYCWDISVKIKSQLAVKRKRGDFVGSFATYGYQKDPSNHTKLIVDELAAETVQDIFRWKISGMNNQSIADRLNAKKVPSPAARKLQSGAKLSLHFRKSDEPPWSAKAVDRILHNEVYTGKLVQGKTRRLDYRSKKKMNVPMRDWVIVDNTHEAIIDKETFEIVQKIRSGKRRPTKMGDMPMFSGLLYCADCGSKMTFHRQMAQSAEKHNFVCSNYRHNSKSCTMHYIRNVVVEQIVLENLKEVIRYVSDYEDEFVQMVMDTDMRQRNKELSQKKKRLTEIHSRIQELDKIFQRIYEDNISGKLSDERFMKLSKGYEEEQHTLQEEQTSLEKELQKEEKQSVDVKQFLSVVRKYTNLTELTPEIVHEFIDKIIVHAPDKSSGKRLQEIEIIYNHIGVFDHSKVTLWKGKAV